MFETLPIDGLQTIVIVTLEELMNYSKDGKRIIIPECQRNEDDSNVNDIIKYEYDNYKTRGSFFFTGGLTLADSIQGLYLVDGQHRYSAIQKIWELQPSYRISLLLVKVDQSFTLEDLFSLINKSKPVPDYVINTVMDLKKRSALDKFEKLFRKEYKQYITNSKSPRRPNVNMQTILNAIELSKNLLSRLESGERIMEYLEWVNLNYWIPMCDEKGLKLCQNKGHLYMSADKDDLWLEEETIDQFLSNHNKPDVS